VKVNNKNTTENTHIHQIYLQVLFILDTIIKIYVVKSFKKHYLNVNLKQLSGIYCKKICCSINNKIIVIIDEDDFFIYLLHHYLINNIINGYN
jgi:hypothetical protein